MAEDGRPGVVHRIFGELLTRMFLGLAGMFLFCAGLGFALMGIAFLDRWNPVVCIAMVISGFVVAIIGRRWERRAASNVLLRDALTR